jgi:hypothetical protein
MKKGFNFESGNNAPTVVTLSGISQGNPCAEMTDGLGSCRSDEARFHLFPVEII